jgi:threonine dehydrogenase-like Zn-dependent dehydrogenase
MKKVVIRGERQAALVEAPEPLPREDWALVKIMVTPMCTEYKMYAAGRPSEFLGHEAVGEVVAVAQPGRVKVGDRVVVMPQYPCGKCALCVAGDYIHCEGTYDFDVFTGGPEGKATYAQYLLKPDWLLPGIPDDVSYGRASLALCALGPSFGAFQNMALSAFDTVLITGMGPVGLGGIANARFRNARAVAVESVPWRMERAAQLGAAAVLDPRDDGILTKIRQLTDGKGVDCALDCSGTVPGQRLCIDATRRKGKVAFVGECNDDLAIRVSPDMIRKGLTLIGSWHYNLNDYDPIMKVIQQSPLLDLLVSHIMPMDQVSEAFDLQMQGKAAKILLHPWG